MDLQKSNQIFLNIYKDNALSELLKNHILSNKALYFILIHLLKKDCWKLAYALPPICRLALIYAYLPITKAAYDKLQISESIFYDTLSDLRIWIDNYKTNTNKNGVEELNWLHLHLNLKLFKLGRLQFQKSRQIFKNYKKDDINLKIGNLILAIHIPGENTLSSNECLQSISMAEVFFKKYFPEYNTNYFSCYSWLLYSKNKDFIKKDSNILKFQSFFNVIFEKEAPSQHYLWIFNKRYPDKKLIAHKNKFGSYGMLENAPQKTSLQKNLYEYIISGGKLGVSYGILNTKDLNKIF